MERTALQEILHTLENDWCSPQPYIDLVQSYIDKEETNTALDIQIAQEVYNYNPEYPIPRYSSDLALALQLAKDVELLYSIKNLPIEPEPLAALCLDWHRKSEALRKDLEECRERARQGIGERDSDESSNNLGYNILSESELVQTINVTYNRKIY